MPDQANNNIRWSFIIQLINRGKITPLLSDGLSISHLFGAADVARQWAQEIEYPLPPPYNRARVAQFLSVVSGDEFLAKTEYLEFLKQALLNKAKSEQNGNGSSQFLEVVADELPDLTVSQTASRLGYTDYANLPDNPLTILANFPLPVYLTTSTHILMEQALSAAGKTPQTDFYRWSEELEEDFFFESPLSADYQPSVDKPLVYHLHGLDTNPASLVLTEENFFEFFEKISHDLEKSEGIPDAVRHALAASSLLLLGYDLQSWSFRVLFRGPIKAVFNRRRPLSLSIQLAPQLEQGISNIEAARNYLDQYFRGYKFGIYWGTPANFTQDLLRHWER